MARAGIPRSTTLTPPGFDHLALDPERTKLALDERLGRVGAPLEHAPVGTDRGGPGRHTRSVHLHRVVDLVLVAALGDHQRVRDLDSLRCARAGGKRSRDGDTGKGGGENPPEEFDASLHQRGNRRGRRSFQASRALSKRHRRERGRFRGDPAGAPRPRFATALVYGPCGAVRLTTRTGSPPWSSGCTLANPSARAKPARSPVCASIHALNLCQSARASGSGRGVPSIDTRRDMTLANSYTSDTRPGPGVTAPAPIPCRRGPGRTMVRSAHAQGHPHARHARGAPPRGRDDRLDRFPRPGARRHGDSILGRRRTGALSRRGDARGSRQERPRRHPDPVPDRRQASGRPLRGGRAHVLDEAARLRPGSAVGGARRVDATTAPA